MRNNLTGFVISALIHTGLFSWAVLLDKKPEKILPPANQVSLMVSMFHAETPTLEPPQKVLPEPVVKVVKKVKPPAPPKVIPPTPVEPEIVEPTPAPVIVKKLEPIPEPVIEPKPIVKQVKLIPEKKKVRKIVKKKKSRIKKTKKIVRKIVKKTPVTKVPRKVVKKTHPRPVLAKPVRTVAVRKPVKRAVNTHNKRPPIHQKTVRRATPQHRKSVPHRAPTTVIPSTQTTNLSNKYKARLRQLIISNKRYPKRAKRRGQQGNVTVSFHVTHSGIINNVKIIKSSNNRTLDNAAVLAIKKSSGKLPFLRGMQKKSLNLSVTLSYVLS